jgi:hypothetical protein
LSVNANRSTKEHHDDRRPEHDDAGFGSQDAA